MNPDAPPQPDPAQKPGAQHRPLRVLVVSQYGQVQVGGAERYLAEVSRRLPSHGFEVSRLSADGEPGERGPLSPALLKVATSSFHPAWVAELRERLRAERPDVLYVHHTVPGLTDVALRVARAMHLPAAVMYHSDVTGPGLAFRVAGAAYDRLVGRASLRAAREIHVGVRGYVGYSHLLPHLAGPFVEAPPGVDEVMAQGQRRQGANPYLLFVGKPDVPSKGFSVLLEAWQHLRALWPELELTVIGAGQGQPHLPGLNWRGQVQSRRELADAYASAALTVLPSTSSAESFGMVLAEALVAGTPVVGSRVGGIPALIEEGVTGCLAEPGDVGSLIAALRRGLEQNDRLRRSVVSRQAEFLTRFNWDRTAAVVADSLRRISSLTDSPSPALTLRRFPERGSRLP